MLELDDVDRVIVDRLIENSRVSLRSIARELRLSPATIHERVQKLIMRGIIKGFTVIVDYKRLGYDVTALIMISVDGKYITEIESWLASQPEIVAVYDITGEFDVAVIAKTRNMTELNSLVKRILKHPHVKRTVTSIAFNVVKEDFRLPVPQGGGISKRMKSRKS